MDSPVPPRGTFENLIYDVATSTPPPALGATSQGALEFTFPAGNRALLLRWTPDEAALLSLAKAAVQAGVTEIVLVGGPPEARALFKQVAPWYRPSSLFPYHLPEQGPLWQGRSSLVRSPLRKLLERGVRGPPDDAAWLAMARQADAQAEESSAESSAFTAQLAARKPLATYALAVVFVAVFLLETALGGSDSGHVLVKLGALVPSRVAAEPWRILSYSFLHAGFMHVLLNTYCLLVLGDLLERVLGSVRFLVVYSAAVLGSGLACLLFSSATLTVGASGGVWGMLAAHAVLSYYPRGLLPQALLPGMRRAAMSNLVLNVVVSFAPHVSMSGHFGGGVAGALLLALPPLTEGLPRPGHGEQPAGDARTPTPLWLRALCGLGVAALALSLGLALLGGARAGLFGGQGVERVPLAGAGRSIELPRGLAAEKPLDQGVEGARQLTYNFGSITEDGVVISVVVRRFDEPVAADQLSAELDGLAAALAKGQEGFAVARKPERKTLHGRGGVTVVMTRGGDEPLTYEKALTLEEAELVTVEAIFSDSTKGLAGSAERVLESMQGDR
jgi:membrane associated rhomboid family serine protease